MHSIHFREYYAKQEDFDLKDIDAGKIYQNYKNKDLKWCFSDIDEVKKNISKFFEDYNKSFNFIKGKVEETLMYEDNLLKKFHY